MHSRIASPRIDILLTFLMVLNDIGIAQLDDKSKRVDVLRKVAWRLSEQGNLHDARRALEGACRLHPSDGELWFALASVLARQRDVAPLGKSLSEVTKALALAHRTRRLLDTNAKARAKTWQHALDVAERQKEQQINLPLHKHTAAQLRQGHQTCERASASIAESRVSAAIAEGRPIIIEGGSPWKFGALPWTFHDLVQRTGKEIIKASVAYADGRTSINQPMSEWRQWIQQLPMSNSTSMRQALRNPECLIRAPVIEMAFADFLRAGQLKKRKMLHEHCGSVLYSHQLDLDIYLPKLRDEMMEPAWLGKDRKPRFTNLWIAASPTFVGLHYDNFDNVVFVSNGSKTVLVFHRKAREQLEFNPKVAVHVVWPENSESFNFNELYSRTCNETCRHLSSSAGARLALDTNHGQANVFDSLTDDEAFSLEDEILEQAWTCEVKEGDALYIPAGAAHAVASTPDSQLHMAVNFWFDPHQRSTEQSPAHPTTSRSEL